MLLSTELLPLVNLDVIAAAKSVGAGTAFVGCMLFLSALLSGFPSLLGLLPAVTVALQFEALDSRGVRPHELVGGVEPKVAYTHETPNCQVPPAEVCCPGVFAASLFWGGLSPVLKVEWLRWRRVNHVLNCMGSVDFASGNTEPNYALAVAARSFDIEYIDWWITHDASRNTYLAVFSRLERILKHPGSCLYVHCKSCHDRGAATMYALLWLQFGLLSYAAWAALPFRVGRNKWPVAKCVPELDSKSRCQ